MPAAVSTSPSSRRLAVGIILWVGACSAPAETTSSPSDHAMTTPHPKQPSPELSFVHGPSIDDAGLLGWLRRQRDGERPATVQLPVVATAQVGGLGSARLAGANGTSPIAVRVDDSALGIALADRMRGSRDGELRAAWLEGTWDPTSATPTLHVTRWVRAIAEPELGAVKHARVAVAEPADRALVAALDRLGSEASAADKETASRQLVGAGVAAIPLLIAARDDGRTFAVRDAVNRTNLPAHERPEPVLVARTVGTHCDELLYRIVTPPPSTAVDHRGKVLSTQVLAVADWRAFWAKRQSRTLAAIHAELVPLVDAYWAQRGTTQRVE